MPNCLDFDHKHEFSGIPAPVSLLSNSAELVAGIRVTRAQFAKMMGCSRQAVTDWVRAGRLTVGPDGRFDPRVAVASLLRTGDPARLRAKVLQPLAAELQALRERIVELEAALGQARHVLETERREHTEREMAMREGIEFAEGASDECQRIFNALRRQVVDAWLVLSGLPGRSGADIIIGWLDLAMQVGPEEAGPMLAALEDVGEEEGGAAIQSGLEESKPCQTASH